MPQVSIVLLENGASASATTKQGYTATHLAAMGGHTAVVKQLHSRGAEVSCQAKNGVTPLHLAALKGHADTATALLARGADRDAAAVYGIAPIHVCAQEDTVEVAGAFATMPQVLRVVKRRRRIARADTCLGARQLLVT
jgi:ankyrin repeat protein